MRLYRMYRLDRAGGIVDAEIIAAEDDAGAMREAERLSAGEAAELWDRARLVAGFGAVRAAA